MVDYGLTVVMSGHLCHPQTSDLRLFWLGFIELQNRLPTEKIVRQIAVHSWNPDLAGLVRLVYAPQVERHENQEYYFCELNSDNETQVSFSDEVIGDNPTLLNQKMTALVANARSRARAIQLLEQLPVGGGQVLITLWDLGLSSDALHNELVVDASLPEEYLYLAYVSEIDRGYPDIWLLAPWSVARKFNRFDTRVIEALTGRNPYLRMFSKTGWPQARGKTLLEAALLHPIARKSYEVVLRILQVIKSQFNENSLLQRIVRRGIDAILRFIMQPSLTAENSCIPGLGIEPIVFPEIQALAPDPLLKYFILSEGLRATTRFLDREDFELTEQSGQLINPQPIVLVVYEEDDVALEHLRTSSPLPFAAIYQIKIDIVNEHLPDDQGGWIVTVLQPASNTLKNHVSCGLNSACGRFEESMPVLLIPSVGQFLGCNDWAYMNALMKYIKWTSLRFVELNGARRGRSHPEFPDLYVAEKSGVFSLLSAAGTIAGIYAFLVDADPDLAYACDANNSKLPEFYVVAREEPLF